MQLRTNRYKTFGGIALVAVLVTAAWSVLPATGLPGDDAVLEAVNIQSPEENHYFGAGEVVELTWRTTAPEFGTVYVYDMMIPDGNGGHVALESETVDPQDCVAGFGFGECTASVQLGTEDGSYILRVYPAGQLVHDSGCVSTEATLCDEVSVHVDGLPPTVTISPSSIPDVESGWYTETPVVTLVCDDIGSGCDKIFYRLDNGDERRHESPFALSDGEHQVSAWATDLRGNTGIDAPVIETLKVDTAEPTMDVRTQSIPTGAGGYHMEPANIEASCTDAGSGSASFVINDEPASDLDLTNAEGTITLTSLCSDIAGNTAGPENLTLRQDLSDPAITAFCATDSCVTNGTIGTNMIGITLTGSDAGAGVAARTVELSNGESSVGPVTIQSGSDSATLDARPLLEEVATDVYTGDIQVKATVTDAVGRVATDSFNLSVDMTDGPGILLELTNQPETLVPNDAEVTLRYEATYIGGPQIGTAASGDTVTLLAGDGSVLGIGITDVAGRVSFTLKNSDLQQSIDAELETYDPDVPAERVYDPGSLTIVWADLVLTRSASHDSGLQNGWVNANETYMVGFKVTLSHNFSPVAGASIVLTSESGNFSAKTNATGVVEVPTLMAAPSTMDFTVEAIFDPSNGPQKTATVDDVQVRWAQVVYSGLDVTNADQAHADNGWNDIGDEVTFDFMVTLDHGAPENQTAAADAVVQVRDGDLVLCETTVLGDGSATCDYARETVGTITPTVVLIDTTQGVTLEVPESFEEQKWAKVVLSDLMASNDGDNAVPGWHDVEDEVSYTATAHMVFGDAEDQTVPAEGAVLKLSASDDEQIELTVDVDGNAGTTLNRVDPTTLDVLLDLVSTPDGITAHEQESYETQKWAVVELTAGTPRNEVAHSPGWHNVGDNVTYPVTALVRFGAGPDDHEPAGDAVVNFAAADEARTVELGTGDDAGAGEAGFRFDVPTKTNVTVDLVSTTRGVTAHEAVDFGVQRWTEIILDHWVDDDFVNVGDEVHFDLMALYAHDEDGNSTSADPVETASVEVRNATGIVLATCAIDTGIGNCTASVGDVYGSGLTYVITESANGILRQEGGVNQTENVIWTGIHVTVDLADVHGTVLDHSDITTVTGTAVYAHDGSPLPLGQFVVRDANNASAPVQPCFLDDNVTACQVDLNGGNGTFTYEFGALSYVEGADGLLEEDITSVLTTSDAATYRWTSIGFLPFECHVGESSGPCSGATYPVRSLVHVVATAVAYDTVADAEPEILVNATVRLMGATLTTSETGQVERKTTSFSEACVLLDARGIEATIGGQTVTWPTPHTEQICFE